MKMIILSSGILPKMEGDPGNFYNYYWTRFEDLKKLHLNSFAFRYLSLPRKGSPFYSLESDICRIYKTIICVCNLQ